MTQRDLSNTLDARTPATIALRAVVATLDDGELEASIKALQWVADWKSAAGYPAPDRAELLEAIELIREIGRRQAR